MNQRLGVVIPAAGRARRFGSNKLLEPLGGQTVIARALRPFLRRDDVACIVIVCDDRAPLERAIPNDERIRFCAGGASRAHSVRAALLALPHDIEWIAVHDAARPLLDDDLIERTFHAARKHGAAAPALEVNLTIKQADGPLPARVQETLDRSRLWALQTPQIMRRADLQRAFDQCPVALEEITDDLQLLELAGCEVWLVTGDQNNIKITTPTDLTLAQHLLAGKK